MKSSDEEELQSDGEFDVAGKDGRDDNINYKQNEDFEFLYIEERVVVYDSEDEGKVDLDYVYEVEFYLSVFIRSEKSSDFFFLLKSVKNC